MMMNTTNVGEYLNVGDYICLYSVETEGYAYSLQSRYYSFWLFKNIFNHLYTNKNLNRYFTNSEDPDEMSHNAAFHQGLHCLLKQKRYSDKNTICFENIT